jgi:hypothetical protein
VLKRSQFLNRRAIERTPAEQRVDYYRR